ncbi:hypothetical protein H632_c242p1 [Helicosporidium sp. ATCC 50920]|nr:hypothetical protein H632_c242p1 [Helicosporidium sp. ATCC 50920]|eukprot:KDD76395.1 hypothetical protein H632_c242p1 [Helicosporidium sp. ATCC 50920]
MASARLEGRTALITGVSGIVGGGIAQQVLAAGARVVAPVRRAEQVAEVRAVLGASPELEVVAFDFGQEEGLRALAAHVRVKYGCVDYVVACLGGHVQVGPLSMLTQQEYLRTISIRAWSQTLAARWLGPLLKNDPSSTYMVVTGKLGEKCTGANLAAYSIASATVYAVVSALRAEQAAAGEEGAPSQALACPPPRAVVREFRIGTAVRRDEEDHHFQFPDAPSAPAREVGLAAVDVLGATQESLVRFPAEA